MLEDKNRNLAAAVEAQLDASKLASSRHFASYAYRVDISELR